MDIGLLLSAALIGFSFSNSFLCTVLAVSTSMGNGIRSSVGFLLGRFLGIIALGSLLAVFGFFVDIDTQIMLYVFGGMTLLFGLVILIFPGIMTKVRLLRKCEVGDCEECDDDNSAEHDCESCSSSSNCGKSDMNVDGSVQNKGRHGFRKGMEKFGIIGITAMGAVRGATPCLKILLLAPLIITLPFLESFAITSTYALTSSIYPVAGIFIASVVSGMSSPKFRRYLSMAGALVMMGIGAYYLYKAWNYSCVSGV
ncbi:MAG: hypothetical protein ACMUIG_08125 [Thermoplasmatota archaeon]